VGSTGQQLTSKLNQLRDGASNSPPAMPNCPAASCNSTTRPAAQVGHRTAQIWVGQLKTGSTELATKLGDGAKQVPTWTPQQKNAIADTSAGPCNSTSPTTTRLPTSPPAWPLLPHAGLFFGALVLWMVLRPLQSRAIAAEVLAIRVVLASYLPAAAIGVFQAIILYCVVRFALGMQVVHPVAMLGFMILVSFAFVAATQAINALVGPAVGRVLIMALLMLQLVSAGGMYPVETTSQPSRRCTASTR